MSLYLLTPVPESPMWRLQGPDNTDSYVDSLDAGLDALSVLKITSVEITATVPAADHVGVAQETRELLATSEVH